MSSSWWEAFKSKDAEMMSDANVCALNDRIEWKVEGAGGGEKEQQFCHVCGNYYSGELQGHCADWHMTRILPHLYLGGAHNACNEMELQHMDIRLIVNVANGLRCAMAAMLECECASWEDTKEQSILDDLDRLVDAIHRQRTAAPGRNVLVHCMAGVSRSPSLIVAYLVKRAYNGQEQELDDFVTSKRNSERTCDDVKQERPSPSKQAARIVSDCTDFVQSRRTMVSPNRGFLKQLHAYACKWAVVTEVGRVPPGHFVPQCMGPTVNDCNHSAIQLHDENKGLQSVRKH